jgi:hypothetical protein
MPAGLVEQAEKAVRDICRKTRKQYSAEEKIRIIRDILAGRPTLLKSGELYAVPVLLGCILFVVLLAYFPELRFVGSIECLFLIFVLRRGYRPSLSSCQEFLYPNFQFHRVYTVSEVGRSLDSARLPPCQPSYSGTDRRTPVSVRPSRYRAGAFPPNGPAVTAARAH